MLFHLVFVCKGAWLPRDRSRGVGRTLGYGAENFRAVGKEILVPCRSGGVSRGAWLRKLAYRGQVAAASALRQASLTTDWE